jgi:uncharacterized protein with GYD domain
VQQSRTGTDRRRHAESPRGTTPVLAFANAPAKVLCHPGPTRRRHECPYLFTARYSPGSATTIMATGGIARAANIDEMVAGLDGRMESFHFSFGDDDAFVIVELPDAQSAAAVALTITGTGVAQIRTTVLLTPEEIDAAAGVHPDYRPPTAG